MMVPVSTSTTGYLVHDFFFFINSYKNYNSVTYVHKTNYTLFLTLFIIITTFPPSFSKKG